MLTKLFTKYWLKRIKNNFINNGPKKFFINVFFFLQRVLLIKTVGEFPFKYFFLKRRILIRKFCKDHLIDFDHQNIKTYFNYFLDSSLIDKNSIIYSFGLATNIKFEEKLASDFDVNVYCFDPTPVAVNYMKNVKNLKLIYQPYGIWVEDKKVKFYYLNSENPENFGGSITNYTGDANNSENLQCYKLKSLMSMNNHNKIDVLKMDIEGAAIEVLNNIFNDNIFPKQIAVEFEVGENEDISEETFQNFSGDIIKLINKLKSLGYMTYHMPRFSNLPYSSIEVLCIRK
jgi:FkbM family methyltransferase